MLSQHNKFESQRGVVIVIALFIMALVATLATVMMTRLARDTHRTMLLQNAIQAEQLATGTVAWAKVQLQADWAKRKKTALVDVIPITAPVSHQDDFTINAHINDEMGRFNLNNLLNERDYASLFKRLIERANPKLTKQQVMAIVLATCDWVRKANGKNELDKYYNELPVPYRAGHRLFATVGEWRNVKGVTPQVYAATSPYLTALPEETQINVQTASPMLLSVLDESFSQDTAKVIVASRQTKPFLTVADFTSLPVVKNHQVNDKIITVTSGYFLLQSIVSKDKQQVVIYTLLRRKVATKNARVDVVAQTKGVW